MANETYSEKVSVNINSSTLSSIDLLVENGYYSNRSDFINQALREALQRNQKTIDRIIDQESNRHTVHDSPWFVGVYAVYKEDLLKAVEQGDQLKITGFGVLVFDRNISDELILSAVKSIQVKGKVVCSAAVKSHFGLK